MHVQKRSTILATSTLTRLAPTQVELEIPITPEELGAAQERAFRKLSKNVKLPGFRPGKIPRRVFEQTYGAEAVESQAMEDVVPEAYAKAVREHSLEPVDRPKMEMLPAEEGKPTRFKVVVEVRPDFDLGTYKGLALARPATTIGDDDVQHSVEALARERATLVPVERPAALGDIVTIDYEGKIGDDAFEGGTAANQLTELDENRFIPGFATGIAGMTAGETRVVEATFPADYQVTDLAGKTAHFTVKLHDVKTLELPTLDDAFAQSVSDNATMDDLRADVRKRLETIAESRARRDLGNQAMEKLLAAHEFPLPESMIDREVEHMIGDLTTSAARAGTTFEEYAKASNKTEEAIREELRADARTRVKGTLLIEAVAKAENIVATPADVQAELSALAGQYGQPVDRIRKALGNNVLSLMDGIVRTKTIEFLIDSAAVTQQEATPASAS